MARKLCILHGNCQGDALAMLLSLSEKFCRAFKIRRVVNYLEERPGEDDLARCSLFLYQYLSPHWGRNATSEILKLLPAQSEKICFPNMFFKGYWPFWRKAENVIEFADSFLEELLGRKLPPEAILKIYNRCDPALTGDFAGVAADTLAIEREKEKQTEIKYVDIIEERWRAEQLFITINHPAVPLLVHVGNSVLRLLGFPPLPKDVTDGFAHPHNEFWLPIHPQVGARLGLPFVFPERKYNCFASRLTHAEYTRLYLACRMNNIPDLTSVMAQLPARHI